MTAQEFLKQKIEEGKVTSYGQARTAMIMEEYAKLKVEAYKARVEEQLRKFLNQVNDDDEWYTEFLKMH